MQNFHSNSIFLIHTDELMSIVSVGGQMLAVIVWRLILQCISSQVTIVHNCFGAAFWIPNAIVNDFYVLLYVIWDSDKMIETRLDLISWHFCVCVIFCFFFFGLSCEVAFYALPTNSPHNLSVCLGFIRNQAKDCLEFSGMLTLIVMFHFFRFYFNFIKIEQRFFFLEINKDKNQSHRFSTFLSQNVCLFFS